MANKVTEEEIILINELYLEVGVKARVAEAVGRSASTVSRYIIPNYISQKDKTDLPPFDMTLISEPSFSSYEEFANACMLTEDEWNELKEMQKEIMI